MTKNKSVLEKKHKIQKVFSYKKGNVTLDFTLNLGVKSELSDFVAILGQAIDEVSEYISHPVL